ncbi:hypothetical protein KJ975_03855 [Myxococcota bacterium]|nr:hypothetical protein [Myxococcota bacterium]
MKISWCSLLLLLVSCAPRQDAWERVSSNPTMPTLRRYILDHPGTEETQIARLHLERLSARAALAAGGIAPLQLHLQAYPAGAHAAEVRGRLMVLRAARALAEDTPWALLRFLYLHPDSKEAAPVRARLEETWWKQLQADPSPHGLKQYLEVFPAGLHETEAQELLAHVIFEKLGPEPDPELLRMFVLNHPKSPTGKRALALLREWERSEVLVSGETTTVVELLRRGESLPAELVMASFAAHLEAALWSFDLDLLGQLCDAAPRQCDAQLPAAIQYWKKMAPQARERLSETVRAAGPFRPMPAFRTLEVALNVEDLHTVWVALRSLSHRPEPRAFALLLSRAGHPDSAIAWPAADACRAWLARWPSRGAVLAAFELRRRQNRRDQFPSLIQTALLSEFLQRPLPVADIARLKPAEPVLLSTLVLQVLTVPAAPWNAFVTEINSSISRLHELFPAAPDRASYPLARNLVRRMYRFQLLLETLRFAPGPFSTAVSDRLAQTQTLVTEWEARLAGFPDYIPSAEDPLSAQIQAHETNRKAARDRLAASADPFGGSWWKIALGVTAAPPPAGN